MLQDDRRALLWWIDSHYVLRRGLSKNQYCKEILQRSIIILSLKANFEHDFQGDSGGPAILRDKKRDKYDLVGIVSWSHQCSDQFPDVYTKVMEAGELIDID